MKKIELMNHAITIHRVHTYTINKEGERGIDHTCHIALEGHINLENERLLFVYRIHNILDFVNEKNISHDGHRTWTYVQDWCRNQKLICTMERVEDTYQPYQVVD